ncbi:MAG: hypothetical protein QM705_12700 [Ancrocorticia sp.]
MKSRRYRPLAAIVALLLVAFGLAACGSEESGNQGGATQSPTAAASESPTEQETAEPEPSRTPEPTPSSTATELTQDNYLERTNAAMLKAKSYRAEMTNAGPTMSRTSVTDAISDPDPAKRAFHMTGPAENDGTRTSVIAVDGMAYVQLPNYAKGKWVKVDGSAPEAGTAEEFLGDVDLLNIVADAEKMKAAITNFTSEANAETIDGVETTKLTLLLDATKYPGGDLGPDAGDTVTVRYFVGPDDLPRRIITQIGVGSQTLELSRWGEPVEVKAPSDEEIISPEEARELEKQG